MKSSGRAVLALAISAAWIGGCAQQSDAFRRLSAEGHEQAASAQGDPQLAEEHIEEAQRLRASEAQACAEVPEADREAGPLARRDRITALRTLEDRPHPKELPQLAGVAVYLRATPGMTEEWLARVLECHVAHHAVVGDRVPDPSSPLFVHDARIALSSTGDGFRIAITARDEARARAILARATALVE